MSSKISEKTDLDYMTLVTKYHESMERNHLNLVYEGEINHSITKAFTALAEQRLNEDKEERAVVRKVYHVLVECLQNIYKHNDNGTGEKPGKKSHGVLVLGHDEGGYIIATGNPISKTKIDPLTEILDRVNEMEVEELNELYKKQMREGLLSEKGGAGLGFIDISRKTNSRLDYKFESLDEKNSFFILKTYIAK